VDVDVGFDESVTMLVGNNAIAFRLVIITKYLFGCLETLGRKQWAGHWTEVQLDEAVMSALGQKQTCVQGHREREDTLRAGRHQIFNDCSSRPSGRLFFWRPFFCRTGTYKFLLILAAPGTD
jgi:hypothetical protein